MKIEKKFFRGFAYIAAAAVISSVAAPARAIDSNAGTGAGSFMKLGMGATRGQALGGAYSAVADGASALAWNPAGAAMAQQREFYFSYLSWVQDYSGKYFGYVHPIGQTVVGLNFAYMGMDGFDVRDANNVPQSGDGVEVQDSFMTLTLARSFFVERLALGASIKRVSENNDGTTYSSVVFDAGAQLHLSKYLSLGGSVQNMGNRDEVVQIARYGAAIHLSSFLTVMGEMQKPSDNRMRAGFGAEISLPEEVLQVGSMSMRVGYYDADSHGKNYDDNMLKDLKLDNTSKLSFGFGLYTSEVMGYGIGLEYAMVPFGALGKVSQFGLKVTF